MPQIDAVLKLVQIPLLLLGYFSATIPALIAGDVEPLTLTSAVYAESRRVSA